jgi:hypothetical protein
MGKGDDFFFPLQLGLIRIETTLFSLLSLLKINFSFFVQELLQETLSSGATALHTTVLHIVQQLLKTKRHFYSLSQKMWWLTIFY